MKEPKWLSERFVNYIHQMQLSEHGGIQGIRDKNLFYSALDKAKNAFCYGEQDVAVLAALYAIGFCKNHPFLDGNKRVALVCCEFFIENNNHLLRATEEELFDIFMQLASSQIDDHEFTSWIKNKTIEKK